jgi:hypothetical protein
MIGFFVAVFCSDLTEKHFERIQEVERTPFMTILLETGKVLASTADNFDFDSAESFIDSAKSILKWNLKRKDHVTFDELVGIDLQAQLILIKLDTSTNSAPAAVGTVKKISSEINESIRKLEALALPRSENKYLVSLSSLVTEDLKSYRKNASLENIHRLLFQFRQYQKILMLGTSSKNPCIKPEQKTLLDLYFASYRALLFHFDGLFDAAERFVEQLDGLVLSNYSLSFDDQQAIELKASSVLDKPELRFAFTIRNAIDISLDLLTKMPIHAEENYYESVTLSSIVLGDLKKRNIFDGYEETLQFLETSDDLFTNQYLPLRDYLKNSVINRHHSVPDYDSVQDITQALNSAECSWLSQVDIYQFYFLVKYSSEVDRQANSNRAIIAFDRLRRVLESSFTASLRSVTAYWAIERYLRIASEDLPDIKYPLPEDRQRYIENVTREISMEILEIIAVSLISKFTNSVIHQLIEEYDQPQYDNFCPGSEDFRKMLKERAKQVPLK